MTAALDVDRLPREARARFWELIKAGDAVTLRRYVEAMTGGSPDRTAPLKVRFAVTLPERHLLEADDPADDGDEDEAATSWLLS